MEKDKTYAIFIPFREGKEILDNLLSDLLPLSDRVNVIGDEGLPVPLTFVQKMNIMQKLAIASKLDRFFFIHYDARVDLNALDAMMKKADILEEQGQDWGVIFSNYDVCTLFNTKKVEEVGQWNEFYNQYYADCDYYYRMRLKGLAFEHPLAAEFVEHVNDGSQTWRNNPERAAFVNSTFKYYRQYYIECWGGDKDQETYTTPFNKGENINKLSNRNL